MKAAPSGVEVGLLMPWLVCSHCSAPQDGTGGATLSSREVRTKQD